VKRFVTNKVSQNFDGICACSTLLTKFVVKEEGNDDDDDDDDNDDDKFSNNMVLIVVMKPSVEFVITVINLLSAVQLFR
jgi:hypothetical protein